MIIFIRHANRDPITIFPTIDNRKDLINKNAQLTHKGRLAAINFGKILKLKYDINNMELTSSPVERCQETLRLITNKSIKIDPIYKFSLDPEFMRYFSKNNDVIKFMNDTSGLRDYMSHKLGIKLNDGMSFYYCYVSMICYQEENIDICIPAVIKEQFYYCTKYIYNKFFDEYIKKNSDVIKNILDKSSGIICTHDNLVFAIAKYFNNEQLNLPGYLSNVVINNDNVQYNTS